MFFWSEYQELPDYVGKGVKENSNDKALKKQVYVLNLTTHYIQQVIVHHVLR